MAGGQKQAKRQEERTKRKQLKYQRDLALAESGIDPTLAGQVGSITENAGELAQKALDAYKKFKDPNAVEPDEIRERPDIEEADSDMFARLADWVSANPGKTAVMAGGGSVLAIVGGTVLFKLAKG